MISATVTGKLAKTPEAKTSSKGTAYTSLSIRTADQLLVFVNLFGDDSAAEAKGLDRGDTVSAVGSLQVGIWEKDGKSLPSLMLLAHRLIHSNQGSNRKA